MEEMLSTFTNRELRMYRIAMTNSKDPNLVDSQFFTSFGEEKIAEKESTEKPKNDEKEPNEELHPFIKFTIARNDYIKFAIEEDMSISYILNLLSINKVRLKSIIKDLGNK